MPGLVPRRGWTATVVSPQHPDPYGEDGTVITEIRNGGTGLRAVMFRDSFASRLIPFLSEHFSRILYQWQNDFDPELVRREQPGRRHPGDGGAAPVYLRADAGAGAGAGNSAMMIDRSRF